jgi:lysophospholipase L1-like esterase
MKTILCFGDSNTWGCEPLTSLETIPRFGTDVRWGSVLRTTLGGGFLGGRGRIERPHHRLGRSG